MFCRKCGHEIPDDSVFCLKCGAKIEIVEQKAQKDHIEEVKTTKAPVFAAESVKKSGNENKAEKSAPPIDNKKVGVMLLFVVMVIIVVVVTAVSNNARKCKFANCDNLKEEGSEYCKDHTCREEGCTFSKSKYDSYCYLHETEHTCAYSGCDNYKLGDGEYCYDHTCVESGCYNKKQYGSDYCTEHQIDMNEKIGNEFSFTVNSAGGIKLNFRAKNNSGKEIKYIRFDVELRNAVGDKIQDEITDEYTISVEVVGPIEHGRSAKFEDIIGYNDNCYRIDIKEITLIYTDGTSQTGHYGWYTEKIGL